MNYLDPITFDSLAEANIYARNTRCANCLGHIAMRDGEGRTLIAYCPRCNDDIYPFSEVSKFTADRIAARRRRAKVFMTPLNKTNDEIMEELGYD